MNILQIWKFLDVILLEINLFVYLIIFLNYYVTNKLLLLHRTNLARI